MSDSAKLLAWYVGDAHLARASEVMGWLVASEIVERVATDCAFMFLGHRPGKNARDAVLEREGAYDFRNLVTNGVVLWHARAPRLFGQFDDIPKLRCPSCKALFDQDTAVELLEFPHPSMPPTPSALACAGCNVDTPLEALVVEDGVFANFVLSFWNWPELRPTFVVKLSKLAGRPATELRSHF